MFEYKTWTAVLLCVFSQISYGTEMKLEQIEVGYRNIFSIVANEPCLALEEVSNRV